MRFVTGADRIVLWVTLAYAREYVIQHYAYAPVTKRIARELSRYSGLKYLVSIAEIEIGIQGFGLLELFRR